MSNTNTKPSALAMRLMDAIYDHTQNVDDPKGCCGHCPDVAALIDTEIRPLVEALSNIHGYWEDGYAPLPPSVVIGPEESVAIYDQVVQALSRVNGGAQ